MNNMEEDFKMDNLRVGVALTPFAFTQTDEGITADQDREPINVTIHNAEGLIAISLAQTQCQEEDHMDIIMIKSREQAEQLIMVLKQSMHTLPEWSLIRQAET